MAKIYEILRKKEQNQSKMTKSEEKPHFFANFNLNLPVFSEKMVIDRRKMLKNR